MRGDDLPRISKAQAIKRLKEANDKLDKARHSNLNLTETELMHIIKFQFYLDKLVKKKR